MNSNLVIFINVLILLAIAIGIPSLCVGLISIFKINLKQNHRVFLYAFTAGLVLILGTVGFLGEAITHAKEHFIGASEVGTHSSLSVTQTLQIIGVVGGGTILGFGIAILSRYIFTQINKNKNIEFHHNHNHHNHSEFLFNASDIDNRHLKWIPILLLTMHRLVDGLVLGYMANTSNNAVVAQFENWGMIMIFVCHLVPTSIVIYLIQLEIQKNKRLKAFLVTIGLLALMVPFTIIGGFLINAISRIWWLTPILYSVSGSLMTISSVMEIIPEFIHQRNASIKQWVWTTLWLGFAVTLAIILLLIHSH